MTKTAADAFREATEALARAGISAVRLEARLLVASVLGVPPEALLLRPERPFCKPEMARLESLLRRRMAREPIAHILGLREFWSLSFRITPDTLIPRPETETVVEAVLANRPPAARPSILDLGTGSGCLLLALLHEMPSARGIGVDISDSALGVARANSESLGLAERSRFVNCHWGEGLDQRFDVIVSNPPYIPTCEIENLSPDVAKFEPRLALDGGADGLERFREIIPRLGCMLNAGGFVAFEVGLGQADPVCAMLSSVGMQDVVRKTDLAGVPRCVIGHTVGGLCPGPSKKRVGNNRFPD
ncbi:MAG: peptide chain release factor N(5)-glutamine methyltransferase [Rhodospirillales bacterium]|nr:peptide chain release factor N(5)-glutamine methyltransferase [Rhodospirillales bacterium]